MQVITAGEKEGDWLEEHIQIHNKTIFISHPDTVHTSYLCAFCGA